MWNQSWSNFGPSSAEFGPCVCPDPSLPQLGPNSVSFGSTSANFEQDLRRLRTRFGEVGPCWASIGLHSENLSGPGTRRGKPMGVASGSHATQKSRAAPTAERKRRADSAQPRPCAIGTAPVSQLKLKELPRWPKGWRTRTGEQRRRQARRGRLQREAAVAQPDPRHQW